MAEMGWTVEELKTDKNGKRTEYKRTKGGF